MIAGTASDVAEATPRIGVTSVGEVANTRRTSSLIISASCAEVVAAN